MKDNKEYLQDIYNKYEQEKEKATVFYNAKINKRSKFKTIAATFLVLAFVTTGVFAGPKIYEKIFMQPSYIANTATQKANNIWCGTFALVWNDVMNELIHGPIEFEGYESTLANELNKQSFTQDMLSEDSYFKVWGKSDSQLKETIEKGIKEKFSEKSNILEDINWESHLEGYVFYVMLKKEFSFLQPFNILDKEQFGEFAKVKYFGIDKDSSSKLYNNVEVLFYNSNTDFAVKLKTKENEDVILYRINESKSFEELYNEILNKESQYDKAKTQFTQHDRLKVPYIDVSCKINYDELCNKTIKGTDFFIEQALQYIDISLDNEGGKILSEAAIGLKQECIVEDSLRVENRNFYFVDNFVMFLKESDKQKPYFAIFVNDDSVLVK